MASQPPALMEELVEEILLRFPPHEPERLVHAALVCKRWCRLISAPCFRRMYREFHRTPPMLGFVCSWLGRHVGSLGDIFDDVLTEFVPTTPVPSPLADQIRHLLAAVDARHGRVLLRRRKERGLLDADGLVVWDLVSGEQKNLPPITPLPWSSRERSWTAAVLCAGSAAGTCNHLDCNRGSFLVVLVGYRYKKTSIYTYSSDDDTWSETVSTQYSYPYDYNYIVLYDYYNSIVPWSPSVLVANALYFQFSYTVLKYDLQSHQMSWIPLPKSLSKASFMLTTTESGGLGLATIHESKVSMWSRSDGPGELDAGWKRQSRVIDLETLPPADAILTPPSPSVVGFADSVGLIFVTSGNALFTIDLRTNKVRKVFKCRGIYSVVPYLSFYTPALKAAYTDDEAACTDDEAST